jgi:hypothetical protein
MRISLTYAGLLSASILLGVTPQSEALPNWFKPKHGNGSLSGHSNARNDPPLTQGGYSDYNSITVPTISKVLAGEVISSSTSEFANLETSRLVSSIATGP